MPKSKDPSHYRDRTSRGPVVYFYRKTEPFGFLSQWYASGFKDDENFPGIYFPTAEHYMHYRKAILFGDQETADKILALEAGRADRALFAGGKVKNFDGRVWDEHKKQIVFRGNYLKFSSPDAEGIREKLMGLKGHLLVECNPKDAIWGIGYSLEDSKKAAPSKWGQNLRGAIIMAVCNTLVHEAGDGEQPEQTDSAGPSQPVGKDQVDEPQDSDDEEEVTDDSDDEESLDESENPREYTGVRHHEDDDGLAGEHDDDLSDNAGPSTRRSLMPFTKGAGRHHDDDDDLSDNGMPDNAGPSARPFFTPSTKGDGQNFAPVVKKDQFGSILRPGALSITQPQVPQAPEKQNTSADEDDNTSSKDSSLGLSSEPDADEDTVAHGNVDVDQLQERFKKSEGFDVEEDLAGHLPPTELAQPEDDEKEGSPEHGAVGVDVVEHLPAIHSTTEDMGDGVAAGQDEQANVVVEEPAPVATAGDIQMELPQPPVAIDEPDVEQEDANEPGGSKREDVSTSMDMDVLTTVAELEGEDAAQKPSQISPDNEDNAGTQSAGTSIKVQGAVTSADAPPAPAPVRRSGRKRNPSMISKQNQASDHSPDEPSEEKENDGQEDEDWGGKSKKRKVSSVKGKKGTTGGRKKKTTRQ